MKMALHLLALALVLTATSLLTGCASGHLNSESNLGISRTTSLSRPNHIYVSRVDATRASYKVAPNELASAQAKVKGDLEKNLVEELNSIAPTSIGSGPTGWLVVVSPIHVDPGSVTMRFLIGFGSGQSKLQARFSLYSLQNGKTTTLMENLDVNADTGIEMGYHTFVEGNGIDSRRISRGNQKLSSSST